MTVIRPNSISGVTSITAQVSDITIFGASSGFANITAGNISAAGTITYEDVTNIDSVGVVTARSGIKIGPTAGVAGTFFADGSYVTAGVITATTFHGSGANLTSLPSQATIANNADNRVITGGSGVNLNGEAQLTFANKVLDLQQNNNSTNTINGTIQFSNVNHTVAKIEGSTRVTEDDGDMKFYTKNSGTFTEALRLSFHAEPKLQMLAGETEIVSSASDGSLTFRADPGQNRSSTTIKFEIDNSEKVRITSDGDLLRGSTGLNNSSVAGQAIQISGTTRPTLILRGNSSGSNTGEIQFADNSGSDSDPGTRAGLIRYDHHGGNIMSFHRNETEGFRMGASENIFIHSENSSGSNGRIYTNKGNANQTVLEVNQNNGSGSEMITFRNNGSQLGTIHQSGSGVSYQSQSDYRLKENDVVISDGITRLKQLRPIKFNWKIDTDTVVDGFFAHEVASVVPEAVRGNKDEVFDTDGVGTQVKGDPKYQQLEQGKLVPLLTAALQEAITKIETLEAKVAALEGS